MSATTPVENNQSDPLLEVQGLGCVRGGRTVLHDVSLSVAPGDLILVTGANGSGKTSLLRCLAGLLVTSAGTITQGAPGDGPAVHVGHGDPAKPHLTVGETMRFWARLAGGDGRGIGAATAAFGLEPLADTLVQLLSAGQRRRLSLARLLLTRGRLWLLDEPTNALDSDNVARLTRTIADHCAGRGAAVVATHDARDFPAGRHLNLDAQTTALADSRAC